MVIRSKAIEIRPIFHSLLFTLVLLISAGVSLTYAQVGTPPSGDVGTLHPDSLLEGGGNEVNGPGDPTHTIQALTDPDGAISPDGLVIVREGDDQTFTLIPNDGCRIDSVVVDGANVGQVAEYTFTAVMTNHRIQGYFSLIPYTIQAVAHAGGSISPAGSVPVAYGSDAEFTVTPATGYHIDSVVVDHVNVGAVSSYMFSSVAEDHVIEAYFSINTYAIVSTVSGAGSITPSGTAYVQHGSDQTYAMEPSLHHHLDSVVVDGINVGSPDHYTFHAVSSGHTIQAFYSIDTYAIASSASGSGTISPSGSIPVPYGATQVFTITPSAGYHLDSIVVDGLNEGTPSSYTFANVAAPHTIHAYFSVNVYTITATSSAGGSIAPAGIVQVVHGSDQTFSMTPVSGYHVDSVLVDGVSIGASSSYTFNNVAASHSISVYYSIDLHTIIATAGVHGSISPSGSIVVAHGDSRSFTVTPDAGYHVAGVVVDGIDQGRISTYTFAGVTAAHTIHALFAINTFTITTTVSAGGSIVPGGAVQADYGSDATFAVTAQPGYHLDSVVVDGANSGQPPSVTFTNVQADHQLAAYFSINRYTVTASAGSGGSITPSGVFQADYGTDLIFTLTPSPGYHVDSVMVNGVNAGAVAEYRHSGISSNLTVSAYFSVNMYAITVAAGSGGSISPAGPVYVAHGGGQSFTFTPNSGYHVVAVIIDGVPVGTPATYAFSNVTAPHTLEVYFAVNGYVITASAVGGGTMTPSGVIPVDYGESVSFSMEPNEGHHLDSVLVDGVNVGPLDNYSFDDVDVSHTITAYFSIDLFSVLATAGAGGDIVPSGVVTVEYGDSVRFMFHALTGHHCDSVIVDGVNVGQPATYVFVDVREDHEIEVFYSPDVLTITASAGAGGEIEPSGVVQVLYGTDTTFAMVPDDGFHLDHLLVDGLRTPATGFYTFKSIATSHTIEALFVPDSIIVTASAGPGGTIVPSGTIPVVIGGSLAITIAPDSGYHIDSVLVDGADEGAIESYLFTDVDRDRSISAFFSLNVNGVPALESISPEQALEGEPAETLEVTGEGFVPASVVRYNGQPLMTVFEDSTLLTAVLGATELATPGSYPVDVFNPAPGGGSSDYKVFTVLRRTEGVGRVTGLVYTDMNGNGHFDDGDILLSGQSVTLTNVSNDEDTYTTGPDGVFTADALDEGTYVVQIEPDDGWELTEPVPPALLTVVIDSVTRTVSGINFGLFERGSISGVVYHDLNSNGTQDPDEGGMAGVRVEASAGSFTLEAFTDDDGAFQIDDASHGTYSVREVIPLQYACLEGRTGYSFTLLSGQQVQSIMFGNASSWDTVRFRTVTMDEWVEAADEKGRLKPIRKKSDKVEFLFPVVADESGTLSIDFNMAVEAVIAEHQDGTGSPIPIDGKKVRDLYLPVQAGDTLWVKGFGLRGKQLKASVAWGSSRKTAVTNYVVNVARLPLPNWHNVGDELFRRGAFPKGLGIGATVFANGGGTVVHRSYRDVLKSLTKRGEVHTGSPKCLDFYDNGNVIVSRLRSLSWDKQDNELFAQQLILKLNIAASDNHYFQPGFGDLMYDNSVMDPDDPFNHQTIRYIATRVDSFLGCLLPTNRLSGDQCLDVVAAINESFSGDLDTISFAEELMFTGTLTLGQAEMFAPSTAPIPIYTPPAPFVTEPVPSSYTLYQNYPNPFNPTTAIGYSLPVSGYVTLKVYNMLGQEVATLLDHVESDEGEDEVEFDASGLSSGVYFYRLTVTGEGAEGGSGAVVFTKTSKMVLTK